MTTAREERGDDENRGEHRRGEGDLHAGDKRPAAHRVIDTRDLVPLERKGTCLRPSAMSTRHEPSANTDEQHAECGGAKSAAEHEGHC